jgi:tetratricopeptide (TPR) repeat protein
VLDGQMKSATYDRTLRYCQRALAADPGNLPLHYWAGRTYASKGMPVQALAALEKWHASKGGLQGRGFGMLAATYLQAGRRKDALRLLDEAMTRRKDVWVSPVSVAQIHLALGQHETALDWLETGYRERDFSIPTLKVEPAYDALRGHPRFVALLERLNLN